MKDTDFKVEGHFELRPDGLYHVISHPKACELWICAPLEVFASSRDHRNENWAKEVRFSDDDGVKHEVPVPEESLLENYGIPCLRVLAKRGLRIHPERGAWLIKYIASAEVLEHIRRVQRVGWFENGFVFPDETIGQKSGHEIVKWQRQSESDHSFNCRGSLEEWRNAIGKYCSGNSRLMFAVSCALAAPLLSLLGEESGVFHFRGPSTVGKTTALKVAGSVCGGGGRNGFLRSWLTTANGLEATLELHNDCLLCLDELSQVSPEEAGKMVYLIANNQGKGRMTESITARQRASWNTLALSSGEVSVQDLVRGARRVFRGGQDVRFADILADAGAGFGLFEDLHGRSSPASFARMLSDATLRHYGTPLREFLKSIINSGKIEWAKTLIRLSRPVFMNAYCPKDASGEVSRIASRFAFVAAAGRVASKLGITGWTEEEPMTATAVCLQSCLDSRGTHGSLDDEASIRQVRAVLEAHPSRFQIGEKVVPNRLGFIRQLAGQNEYCVLPQVFANEVCTGFDPKMVAKALDERGYLRHAAGRLQVKVRLPGGPPAWVYAIRESVLSE